MVEGGAAVRIQGGGLAMTTEASISEGLGSTRDEGQRKLTEEARRGSSLLRVIVICEGPAVSNAYSTRI